MPVASATSSGSPIATLPLPDHVDDLLACVPAEASIIVTFPSSTLHAPGATFVGPTAKALGVPESLVSELAASFDGLAAFNLGELSTSRPSVVALVRLKDARAMDDLVSALKLQQVAEDHYVANAGGIELQVTWLRQAHVVVVGTRDKLVDAALDAFRGKRPSFASSAFAKRSDDQAFVFADLHALFPDAGALAAGSHVAGLIGPRASDVSFVEIGEKVPRFGTVIAPIGHDALGALPSGALAALQLSLERRSGKTVADLLGELGRPNGDDPAKEASAALKELAGASLGDVDAAVGESLVVGVYLPPSAKTLPLDAVGSQFGVVASLDLKDDALATKLFAAAKKTKPRDATWSEGKVVIDLHKGRQLVIRLAKNKVLVTTGDTADATRLASDAERGSTPLSKSPAFAGYASTAIPSQASLFFDADALAARLPAEMRGAVAPKAGATDFVLQPSTTGIDLSIKGAGGTAVLIGVGSALAVYGVRSYLTSAKTAEAKNIIGAIARSAVMSYEREAVSGPGGAATITHQLCSSAHPAPATVPRGIGVTIEPRFFTDDDGGWRCLRFEITDPIHYQYEYRAGGPYKCVSRGGPDPGKDGFEVSAEGDLNGDGKTSLFCVVGKRDGGEDAHLERHLRRRPERVTSAGRPPPIPAESETISAEVAVHLRPSHTLAERKRNELMHLGVVAEDFSSL